MKSNILVPEGSSGAKRVTVDAKGPQCEGNFAIGDEVMVRPEPNFIPVEMNDAEGYRLLLVDESVIVAVVKKDDAKIVSML